MESPKQQALEVLKGLPDECTWQEIHGALSERKKSHESATETIDWDDFVRRIRVLLHDEFPDAERLQFDRNSDGRTISGCVVSSDFGELDNADRQDRLWDILEKNLSIDEQSRILSIMAYTPEEQEKEEVEA